MGINLVLNLRLVFPAGEVIDSAATRNMVACRQTFRLQESKAVGSQALDKTAVGNGGITGAFQTHPGLDTSFKIKDWRAEYITTGKS